jgi:hypothetical protein
MFRRFVPSTRFVPANTPLPPLLRSVFRFCASPSSSSNDTKFSVHEKFWRAKVSSYLDGLPQESTQFFIDCGADSNVQSSESNNRDRFVAHIAAWCASKSTTQTTPWHEAAMCLRFLSERFADNDTSSWILDLSKALRQNFHQATFCDKPPTITDLVDAHLSRRGKTALIAPEFRNVVVSNSVRQDVNSRHVLLTLNSGQTVFFHSRATTSLFRDANEQLRQRSCRVLIFGGSSGSGKTVAALDYALRGSMNLVSPTVDDSTPIVFYLKCAAITTTDTAKRNDDVASYILRQISILLSVTGDDSSLPAVTKIPDKNQRIFIIVDEVGSYPAFLRGFIAVAEHVSRTIHNHFFEDQVAENEIKTNLTRVHFIAAGTGSSFATTTAGSAVDHYSVHLLDVPSTVEKEGQTVKFDIYQEFVNKFEFLPRQRRLLLRLAASPPSDSMSATSLGYPEHTNVKRNTAEELASSVVSNPRAAAFFLHSVLDSLRTTDSWSYSLPAFRRSVEAILPTVTRRYIDSNGLKRSADALATIVASLAFAVHRFPFMPYSILPAALLRETARGQLNDCDMKNFTVQTGASWSIDPKKINQLYDFFCTESGIVVDFAKRTPQADAALAVQLDEFVPPTPEDDTSSGCLAVDTSRCCSRFHVPAAHAAMAYSFLGLSSHHPDSESHWTGAEKLAQDVCTTLVSLSRVVENLYEAVDQELAKFGNQKTMSDFHKHAKHAENDPLFQLKQVLRFGRGVEGVQARVLHDSPLQRVNAIARLEARKRKTNDWWIDGKMRNAVREAEQLARKTKATIRELLQKNQAVVLTSPDMESFADLIVIGPKKVVLLQCKSMIEGRNENNNNNNKNKTNKTTNFLQIVTEFSKMNLCDPEEIPDFKKIEASVAAKLRELWLRTFIGAAAMDGADSVAAPSNGNWTDLVLDQNMILPSDLHQSRPHPDVEVHATYFVECSKARYDVLRQEFNTKLGTLPLLSVKSAFLSCVVRDEATDRTASIMAPFHCSTSIVDTADEIEGEWSFAKRKIEKKKY